MYAFIYCKLPILLYLADSVHIYLLEINHTADSVCIYLPIQLYLAEPYHTTPYISDMVSALLRSCDLLCPNYASDSETLSREQLWYF